MGKSSSAIAAVSALSDSAKRYTGQRRFPHHPAPTTQQTPRLPRGVCVSFGLAKPFPMSESGYSGMVSNFAFNAAICF